MFVQGKELWHQRTYWNWLRGGMQMSWGWGSDLYAALSKNEHDKVGSLRYRKGCQWFLLRCAAVRCYPRRSRTNGLYSDGGTIARRSRNRNGRVRLQRQKIHPQRPIPWRVRVVVLLWQIWRAVLKNWMSIKLRIGCCWPALPEMGAGASHI